MTQISSKVSEQSVLNPSKIRRQAKIFKETGSVKNRKVNCQRHVLIEETLDEIGERLEHTPQKSLKCLSQETDVCTKSKKITEFTYTYCEYTHFCTMRIPV